MPTDGDGIAQGVQEMEVVQDVAPNGSQAAPPTSQVAVQAAAHNVATLAAVQAAAGSDVGRPPPMMSGAPVGPNGSGNFVNRLGGPPMGGGAPMCAAAAAATTPMPLSSSLQPGVQEVVLDGCHAGVGLGLDDTNRVTLLKPQGRAAALAAG